jgi:hypothetical protein
MKELTAKQVGEVSGGIFINPVTVMIGVRIAQLAKPHIKRGILAAAAYIGGDEGYRAAQP